MATTTYPSIREAAEVQRNKTRSNSNDIICNSLKLIENGVLVTLDQKIASGSTDDISAIINDTTFKNLATLNNYTQTTDVNTALALKADDSDLTTTNTTVQIATTTNSKGTMPGTEGNSDPLNMSMLKICFATMFSRCFECASPR